MFQFLSSFIVGFIFIVFVNVLLSEGEGKAITPVIPSALIGGLLTAIIYTLSN